MSKKPKRSGKSGKATEEVDDDLLFFDMTATGDNVIEVDKTVAPPVFDDEEEEVADLAKTSEDLAESPLIDPFIESVLGEEIDVIDDSIFTFDGHRREPVYCVALHPNVCADGSYQVVSGGGDDSSQSWRFSPMKPLPFEEAVAHPTTVGRKAEELTTAVVTTTDMCLPICSEETAAVDTTDIAAVDTTDIAAEPVVVSDSIKIKSILDEPIASDKLDAKTADDIMAVEATVVRSAIAEVSEESAVADGSSADSFLHKHKDSVVAAHYSFDGSILAVASMDGTISFFDCVSSKSVHSVVGSSITDALSLSPCKSQWFEDTEGPYDIEFVEWHPKGLALIVGCRDSTVWLFEVTPKSVFQQRLRRKKAKLSAKRSAATKKKKGKKSKKSRGKKCKSAKLRSATEERRVAEESGETTEIEMSRVRVLHVFSGHIGPVTCGHFTFDGKYAFSGSEDGSLFVWNCKTGGALQHFKGGQKSLFHVSAVTCCDDQRESALLATGGSDQQVVVSNYKTGKWLTILGEELRQWHKDSVEVLHFCKLPSHREYLASGALDGAMKIWDLNRQRRPRVEFAHEDSVTCAQWCNSQPLIATAMINGVVSLWDARNGRAVRRFGGHRAGVHCLHVSADDKFLVTSADDGLCKVFELQ